ncbi:hypothetical protein UlMin_031462 [Ulmus minor]
MTSSKLTLLVFLFSVAILSASLSSAKKDPELRDCKQHCKDLRGADQEEKRRCAQRCEEESREKREENHHEREESSEEEESYEQQRHENPYVFRDEHFDTTIRAEQGRVQFLPKFTDRSRLLRGIRNYRVGFLEANPRAFVTPVHIDAEIVFFVARGRPTVTLLKAKEKENRGIYRESFNLEVGDILRIPAGITTYLVNRDEREKLFIVKLINPVSLPGRFEPFYGAGGENPESFYTAFSDKVLRAALKRESDEIERLFRQQKRGSIVQASREQVQELSRQAQKSSAGFWPFRDESRGPINLFNTKPTQSNRYGTLHEADPNEHKQLQDLELLISFANITKGAMVAPYYNTKATRISFVVEGNGFFEMACPHISSDSSEHEHDPRGSQGRQQGSPSSYQRVSGRLNRGVVFVVPAGHPVTVIASKNSNLQVLCFEVNAKDNIRFPLAGKNNVVSAIENVAKELAFSVPAREVERVFQSQNEEFFFPGPKEQDEGRRAYE